MTRFVRACSRADLPRGGRFALEIEGRPVALFHTEEGRIFAIEDRCPHQWAPLVDGELQGTRIRCRWHGWTFEMDTAKPAAAALPQIGRYSVRVEGEDVLVGL